MIKQLPSLPEPIEIINKMQADILDLYETFDNERLEIFKNDPISYHDISYFNELPLRKELCENWHGLQIDIDSKFKSIAKEQDESVVWKNNQCYCSNVLCRPCKKWDKCMDHLNCQEPQSSFNPFKSL